MRPLKIAYTIIFLFLISACAQNTATVGTDHNLEVANFDTYKTYTFASHVTEEGSDDYFWNSKELKSTLKENVKNELIALGYEYAENQQADLLVNFMLFDEAQEITGFVDNYADENYWGPMEIKKEAIGLEPSAETREPGDARTYELEKGSVLIQMADVKQGVLVWQGYASDVVGGYAASDENKQNIAIAVEKIFEKYTFEASGYARN